MSQSEAFITIYNGSISTLALVFEICLNHAILTIMSIATVLFLTSFMMGDLWK